MSVRRANDLLLQASLGLKQGIDPIIPLMETAADEDPDYVPIRDCYKNIKINLDKSVELLKALK